MKPPAHATIDFENESNEFPARMMDMPISDWAYNIIYAQFETEHNQ